MAAGAEPTGRSRASEMWAVLAQVRVNSAILTRLSPYRIPRFNVRQRTFARIPPNALAQAELKSGIDNGTALGYTREKQGGVTSANGEDSYLYAKVPFRPS